MPASPGEITAVRVSQSAIANGFPFEEEWARADPVTFSHDWRGENRDPQRQTEVRLLWTDVDLFVRFHCSYRSLDVFPDSASDGRRDELWDRDVAEVFLQPDRFGEKYYKEFEISPTGQWLDLDISPKGLAHITSGLRTQVRLDEAAKAWTAYLAIPLAAITWDFDFRKPWRVNFFRCEGIEPQRFYSSWQPTNTPQPDFHVPQKFGWLHFGN